MVVPESDKARLAGNGRIEVYIVIIACDTEMQ